MIQHFDKFYQVLLIVVVAELLQQPDCVVHALVRKGSEHKLDQIRQQLGSNGQRLRALSGDLTQPGLGLSRADQQRFSTPR